MTEAKLQQAANALPEPRGDFLAVEESFQKQQTQMPIYQRKRRRLAWMLCIALLLTGCVMGPTVPEYHLYNGSLTSQYALDSARKAATKADWTIPEALGASPILNANKYNLTTKESSYLMAQLFYHYTYHSVNYGYTVETDITLENGAPSVAVWVDTDVELTFGSLDNEVWRRQFSFNGEDTWEPSSKYLNYIDTDSLEYGNFTLYIGTCQYSHDFYGLTSAYGQFVSWVDYDHNTAFSLYCRDDTPDFAIACAKELIDQMHAEKPR